MAKKVNKKRKSKKKFKILIFLFILGFAALGAYYVLSGKRGVKEKVEDIVNKIENKEEPKLQIVDEDSTVRSVAVMIPHDSWGGAQTRQYGIQDAYVIYEILAEGGITRLEAIFRDVNPEKIGPIRSSRSYYLDYAMEHDAIYVHWGWSPQAQSDISSYKINNINGIYEEGISIFRDSNYSAPNNGYTSMETIMKRAEQKGYATTSNKWKVFKYSISELDYSNDASYRSATNLVIGYSNSYSAKYTYDEEHKYYLRYNNDSAHIDNATGEQLHVKNILVLKINYSLISGDDKGRIDLKNIGEGNGYYITNGGVIDITWKKESRNSKTKYYDKEGNELLFNDGNIFVQVQPVNYSLTIE